MEQYRLRENNIVTIAVIDSGIIKDYLQEDTKILKCTRIKCEYNKKVTLEKEETMEADDIHGTEVLNTIEKYSEGSKKQYYIYNVFFKGKSSSYSVLEALRECLEIPELDIVVISLSCGKDFYTEYEYILKKLYKKGVRIFSSLENESEYSIPAGLPFVYGVGGKPICKNNGYIYDKNKIIQFVANNEYEFIYRTHDTFFCFKGNSKANAIISGIAVSYLYKYGKKRWEDYFLSNISDLEIYKIENDEILSKVYDDVLADKAIKYGLFEKYNDIGKKISYNTNNLSNIIDFLSKEGYSIDWSNINYYKVYSFLKIFRYINNRGIQDG